MSCGKNCCSSASTKWNIGKPLTSDCTYSSNDNNNNSNDNNMYNGVTSRSLHKVVPITPEFDIYHWALNYQHSIFSWVTYMNCTYHIFFCILSQERIWPRGVDMELLGSSYTAGKLLSYINDFTSNEREKRAELWETRGSQSLVESLYRLRRRMREGYDANGRVYHFRSLLRSNGSYPDSRLERIRKYIYWQSSNNWDLVSFFVCWIKLMVASTKTINKKHTEK